MAFDFGTWLIGYSLSKLATNQLDKNKNVSLSKKMNSIVIKWAEELPDGIFVNPESLFPNDNILIERNNQFLDILREKILIKELPSLNDFSKAIFEQWKLVRVSYGDEAQSFYLLSENKALIYIDKLSESLHFACKLDTDIFKVKIISDLEKMSNKIDSLKPKDSLQDTIQSKISIINELRKCIFIFEDLWPPKPFTTKNKEDYQRIHDIIENVILSIHFSYSLIMPYCDINNISSEVRTYKDDLINGLKSYLEIVDEFYYTFIDLNQMESFSSEKSIPIASNVEKFMHSWTISLILIREYLKSLLSD